MISFEVLQSSTEYRVECESLRNQVPTGADRGPESVAAIETNRNGRLTVTRAYPAFALPARYACDGC